MKRAVGIAAAMIVLFIAGAVSAGDITVSNKSSYKIKSVITIVPGGVRSPGDMAPGSSTPLNFPAAVITGVTLSNQSSPTHGNMVCTMTYSGERITPSHAGDYRYHSVFVWNQAVLPMDQCASLSVECVNKN